MAGKRAKCDWCGNDLLKMRNGVLRHLQRSNNAICDACWGMHEGEKFCPYEHGTVCTFDVLKLSDCQNPKKCKPREVQKQ